MNGITPYAYMQQVSIKTDELGSRQQIETVLDEMVQCRLQQAQQG